MGVANHYRVMGRMNKPQLFLLHFAGGSCYSYDFLRPYLNHEVDFIPIELPGRGKRFRTPLIKDKSHAIQDYYAQVKKLRNGEPYLIYGHSMGATLGLNLTREMEKERDPPFQLIVSGNAGPGYERIDKEGNEIETKTRYLMSEEEFKEELRDLGGAPEEVLDNDELYQFFSPIMRADFELLEKDSFSEKGMKTNVPILSIMGTDEMTSNQITNWKNFTTNTFDHRLLEGNHFFIHDRPEALAAIILRQIKTFLIS